MKKLFLLLLAMSLVEVAPGAPPKPKPAEPPTPAAPAQPRRAKPGFWERAWVSTQKGSERVGRTLTRPFRWGKSDAAPETKGWRELAMSLTLDPADIQLSTTKVVKAVLTVVNQGKVGVQLEFPTTQRIEVLLKTPDGNVLSRWSEDQKFEAEEEFLVINTGERLEYAVNVSTREMKPGASYIIEAYFPSFDQLRASRTVTPTK